MTATDASNFQTPLAWTDKLLLLVASAIAAALFLSVGWLAVAPDDPRAAVSLITHGHATMMAVQAAALAAVTAAIATVIVGTKVADIGVFATGVGLWLVAVRGDTAAYLLIHIGRADRSLERALAGRLAVEAIVWFAIVLAAMFVSGLVFRWCFGSWSDASGSARSSRVCWTDMAISDCPGLSSIGGVTGAGRWGVDRQAWVQGLKVTGVTAGVALCVYAILVAGSSPRWIRHGQTCFAVFVAFLVGVWASRFWFASRTAFWGLLAVPLACVLGYAWAMVIGGQAGDRYSHLACVPASSFLRVLPMTYVAVGTLAVMVAHWYIPNKVPKKRAGGQVTTRRTKR